MSPGRERGGEATPNPKPEEKCIPHRVKYDHQTIAKETSVETTAERARLIAEVMAFVRVGQRLPGVSRIALISFRS